MQTLRNFLTGNYIRFFLLFLLLSSILLAGLSGCGKKGPLYREDAQQQK
jgi:predicted small lipoprotein YifL